MFQVPQNLILGVGWLFYTGQSPDVQKSKGRKTIRLGGRREWVGGSVIKWSKSLRRGGSPSKSACGPGTRKARLFVNAVWAACVGRADHQAMYAWAVALRRCAGAVRLRACASSRMKEDASSLNRPPTSNATTTNLHLPPRRGSGRFALWLFWRLPKLLRCMFRAAVVAALRWCWVTPA